MSWLTNLFKDVENIFNSPKTKAVAKEIETLTVEALPIVQALAALVPSTSAPGAVAKTIAAYEKYGVPTAQLILSGSTSVGQALEQLAVTVLQKNHQDAAANVLVTAVNVAVSANKASAK
jgi:hypothetical protein